MVGFGPSKRRLPLEKALMVATNGGAGMGLLSEPRVWELRVTGPGESRVIV